MTQTEMTLTGTPRRRAERCCVAAGAVLLAIAAWALLHTVLGIDLRVRSGSSTSTVGVLDVVLISALAALGGWACLAVLERLKGRPRRTWTVLAGVALLVSLFGPLGAASASAGVALLVLHLLVGLTILVGLRRTAG